MKKVHIRRSHSRGEHLYDITKTKKAVLSLSDGLVNVLQEHIAQIEASPLGSTTELLFPSTRWHSADRLVDTPRRAPWIAVTPGPPSVEHGGKTAVDQDHWVNEAMMFGVVSPGPGGPPGLRRESSRDC